MNYLKYLSLIALGGLLLVPVSAMAQRPYFKVQRSSTFKPLPIGGGEVTEHFTNEDTKITGNIFPDGFTFRFFGEEKTEVYADSNGYATFAYRSGGTSGNQNFPATGVPNDLIALFWDDMVTTVKSQVIGRAPNRTFIIEWIGWRYVTAQDAKIEMQLWLHEGSSVFEMHYGEAEWGSVSTSIYTASMGYEDSTGNNGEQIPSAATGANCNTSCKPEDWHTHTVFTFTQGPWLDEATVYGPAEAFAGITTLLSAEVTNVGGEPAENFTVRFWVSPIPEITNQAIELVTLENESQTIGPDETARFVADPRLPIELDEGDYYILAEFDPFHSVPLPARDTTIGVYGPFQIGVQAPNLTVGWVEAPEVVSPGATFDVDWLAQNIGNLETYQIPYRVVLSRSRSVSPLSITIGEGTLSSLALQDELEVTTEVTIPFDLDPGMYYVGVQMDPDRVVFEHDRRDNAGMSNTLLVWDHGLVVLTQDLPEAHFQGHYSVRLMAYGGDGHASWSVKPGSTLPPGLSLVVETSTSGETATFLRGIPSKKGVFPFTLEVRSGEHVEEQHFTLSVTAGEHALSVMTQSLAEAAFGFEYEDWLSGLGGVPPYNWELANGSLPQGIFLRADGLLSGRPEEDGHFPVTFRLTDSQGLQTTRELVLNVTAPSALTCVTKELPRLKLGEAMRPVPLLAAGGIKTETGAYLWDSISTVRQVTTIGEISTNIEEGVPPGLRLEQGSVQGTPTQGGTYTWTVKVTDTVGATQDCPIRVDVERDHGLTVATRSLPTAVAGRSYRARIEVLGGDGHHQFSELEPGRTLADLGLRFDENGFLTGTPSLDLLEGEKEREFAFTVRVQDEKNRIGIGALTIRIAEKGIGTSGRSADADEGGCQAGSGDAGLGLIALLGLAALGRRRR